MTWIGDDCVGLAFAIGSAGKVDARLVSTYLARFRIVPDLAYICAQLR